MSSLLGRITSSISVRASTGVLVLGIVASALCVALGTPPLIAVAAALVSALTEPFLPGRVRALLRRASAGHSVRLALRVGLVALAVGVADPALVVPAVLVAAALVVVRTADNLAGAVLSSRRTTAIATRNLGDLPGTSLPVPRPVTSSLSTRTTVAEPVALAGLGLATLAPGWLAACALAVLAYAALTVLTALTALRLGRRGTAETLVPAVRAALDARAPRVALYLSGDAASVYQADMWLAALEEAAPGSLVVLRERRLMQLLGTTSLPVVCVPDATTLMNLGLPTLRAALYPANVGKNIHLLREPHVLSVFVGHGDSDKNASFNPFTRVYDEVWVAGPAGRERYRRARVGVLDTDVVEVGRPQAAALAAPVRRPADAVPTLLYAPTWEGWNEEQDYGSVDRVGLALVERLLAEEVPVRIVYRPHPFTGRRRGAVLAAHRRLVGLLTDASARAGQPQVPVPALLDAPEDAVGHAAAVRARDDAWFAARPRGHAVVEPGSGIGMEACMAVADVLVTDVSSVLSDWLATGRPYAVTAPPHVGAEGLVHLAPSASGGTVVAADGTGLDEVVDVLHGRVDPHAAERARLRLDVLGPAPHEATATFAAAVDRIVARSERRLAALAAAAAEADDATAAAAAVDDAPDPGPVA